MIDCENEVYTRIVRMLREEFPGINVAGEYTKTPSSFPLTIPHGCLVCVHRCGSF